MSAVSEADELSNKIIPGLPGVFICTLRSLLIL